MHGKSVGSLVVWFISQTDANVIALQMFGAWAWDGFGTQVSN